MPSAPTPPSLLTFDDPRLRFSRTERVIARATLWLIALFFGAVALALLYFDFPRDVFSPEYVIISLQNPLASLLKLFTPGFALGMLLALMLVHELMERNRARGSLGSFRRTGKPATGNGARYIHPDTLGMLERIIDRMQGKDLDALIPAILRTGAEHPRLVRALSALQIDPAAFGKDAETLQGLMDRAFERENIFTPQCELFQRLLREALLEALMLGHDAVMPEDVILATLDEEVPALKTFLARWNIHQDDLRSVAYVAEARRRRLTRGGSRTVGHRIMNRAWTARPTYVLDRFSQDLTDLAREGYAGFMVGHQTEAGAIVRILNRMEKNHVLLVGEAGSGKTTILEHLAWLITREEVPQKLFDKRLVMLDVGLLVAGAKSAGELQERAVQVVNDIVRAGNVILAVPDIHGLLTAGSQEGVSVSSVIGPALAHDAFQVIGLTDPKSYRMLIEPNAEFRNHFDIVEAHEITQEETLRVLAGRAQVVQELEGITVTYPALKKAVDLAARYIHDKQFPAKAVDLLGEGVEFAKRNKKRVLTDADIAALVSERLGIPVTDVTKEESVSLLALDAEIHKRIVGQEEAVTAVADVIKQSRAGVRRANAPVGSFLFVGPTGVGKTECAKALADIYYHNPDAMARFDMSEYQTRESVYRLIGTPDGTEPGQLTERMKRNPYSLILLDEFEKAHANILDLFLQVLDDGRVTDATGTLIDFTNAIIIATSNAHSVLILESLKAGIAPSTIAEGLKEKLTAYFKPELLNRFDDIIVFKPLTEMELRKIAEFQLKELFVQLQKDRGIALRITSEAVVLLATLGYTPEFGARPLRHVIRKRVRDLIAEEILKNALVRGDTAVIDARNNTLTLIKTL